MRKLLRLAIALTLLIAIAAALVIAYTLATGHLPARGGDAFADDFESEQLRLDRWELDADDECRMAIAPDPTGAGRSLHIVAPEGSRCELLPLFRKNLLGKGGHEPRGRRLVYQFKTYTPGGQRWTGKNEIWAQWHGHPDRLLGDQSLRGPALALRAQDNRVFLSAGFDTAFLSARGRKDGPVWVAPRRDDSWVEWRFEVLWSLGLEGYIKVWRDAEPVYESAGPNTFNDLRNVYLKIGVYHPRAAREMFFDDFYFEAD